MGRVERDKVKAEYCTDVATKAWCEIYVDQCADQAEAAKGTPSEFQLVPSTASPITISGEAARCYGMSRRMAKAQLEPLPRPRAEEKAAEEEAPAAKPPAIAKGKRWAMEYQIDCGGKKYTLRKFAKDGADASTYGGKADAAARECYSDIVGILTDGTPLRTLSDVEVVGPKGLAIPPEVAQRIAAHFSDSGVVGKVEFVYQQKEMEDFEGRRVRTEKYTVRVVPESGDAVKADVVVAPFRAQSDSREPNWEKFIAKLQETFPPAMFGNGKASAAKDDAAGAPGKAPTGANADPYGESPAPAAKPRATVVKSGAALQGIVGRGEACLANPSLAESAAANAARANFKTKVCGCQGTHKDVALNTRPVRAEEGRCEGEKKYKKVAEAYATDMTSVECVCTEK